MVGSYIKKECTTAIEKMKSTTLDSVYNSTLYGREMKQKTSGIDSYKQRNKNNNNSIMLVTHTKKEYIICTYTD